MNFIDPATLQLVQRALDAGALRHQAIAQNIANASVPGAKPLHVRFESLLGPVRADLADGRPLQMADIPSPSLQTDPAATIELDEQMAALSSNSLQYQALLKALSRELSILSIAAQEGRR